MSLWNGNIGGQSSFETFPLQTGGPGGQGVKKRPVAVASVFGNDDSDEDEEEMPEHARKDTQPFVHHLIF